jgi:hypothetical protein
MIVYSRVMNGMINTTALAPYTDNTENDFWISHDDEIKYSPGDIYVPPVAPKVSSSWGVTSMDADPITFVASTV